MGFTWVPGQSPGTSIKLSFEHSDPFLAVFPRPLAVQLLDRLSAFAEARLAARADTASYIRRT